MKNEQMGKKGKKLKEDQFLRENVGRGDWLSSSVTSELNLPKIGTGRYQTLTLRLTNMYSFLTSPRVASASFFHCQVLGTLTFRRDARESYENDTGQHRDL